MSYMKEVHDAGMRYLYRFYHLVDCIWQRKVEQRNVPNKFFCFDCNKTFMAVGKDDMDSPFIVFWKNKPRHYTVEGRSLSYFI